MIRVLVVEDSPLSAKLLSAMLEEDFEISVVGVAQDGLQAIAMVEQLKPNVVTMDIGLPKMDGLEVVKQIMSLRPTPILIVSSLLSSKPGEVTPIFRALSLGALDAIEKRGFDGQNLDENFKRELIEKVKLLSRIHVVPHLFASLERRKLQQDLNAASASLGGPDKIVGIVASTGGPEALNVLLKGLPVDFPMPIAIVQHISPGFTEGLVEWLKINLSLKVKLAEDGEFLQTGSVYIAPSGFQMRISPQGKVALSKEKIPQIFCPSGNLLLESIAQVYQYRSLGVILTGMGSDGVDGLKKIHEARGQTIAQDEKSSVVFGMPKAAIDLGIIDKVLPLDQIADKIIQWAKAGI